MGHLMLASFEYSGLWWLPENPENKIHGKLSYDLKKGTTLSLDGAFTDYPDNGNFYEIILGDSYGKKITLSNCLLSNFHISRTFKPDREYRSSEFRVSVLYVGCHFPRRESIKFSRLHVRFSQLEEWLGKRVFNYKLGKNERQHVLEFTMPNAKEVALDKFKISINYGFSSGLGVDDWLKPKFEANVGISIEATNEMYIEEFFSAMHHIRSFLSLGTGNRISVLEIIGTRDSDHKRVQIFYRREIPDEKLFSYPFFPFQYKSVSEHFESYLRNWFNIVENFEPTYDLFFGVLDNPHLYPNHTFLSLTQALESYLSKTLERTIMSDELFDELKLEMLKTLDALPQEYKQQLKPKVEFDMNRRSFRTKLRELFERYGSLFSLFIDDKDDFIRKVVDTRNYYTHYSPELEERAVKMEELPFLSQNLRFILIVILLKEIGFDNKLIEQTLRKYMRFRIRCIVH